MAKIYRDIPPFFWLYKIKIKIKFSPFLEEP